MLISAIKTLVVHMFHSCLLTTNEAEQADHRSRSQLSQFLQINSNYHENCVIWTSLGLLRSHRITCECVDCTDR